MDPGTQHSDTERYFVRLRSVLEGFGRFADDLGNLNNFDPTTDSAAFRELQAQHGAEIRFAHTAINLLLSAALDYMYGLAHLVQEPIPEKSVLALCRTALENSARAAWLSDPNLDPLQRARRGLIERLDDLYEAAAIEKTLVGEKASTRQEQLDKIMHAARSEGFHIHRDRGHEVDGEKRPSATAMIGAIHGDQGKGLYRFLSGTAHGSTSALLFGMTTERSDIGGLGAVARNSTTYQTIATALAGAGLTYCTAFDQKISLYGWATSHWESWRRHALQILRRPLP